MKREANGTNDKCFINMRSDKQFYFSKEVTCSSVVTTKNKTNKQTEKTNTRNNFGATLKDSPKAFDFLLYAEDRGVFRT